MTRIQNFILLSICLVISTHTSAQITTSEISIENTAGLTTIDGNLQLPSGSLDLKTNQVQFSSASGGNNRIQSFGGSGVGTWLFQSRFDNMVFNAGELNGPVREMHFQLAGSEIAKLTQHGFYVGEGRIQNDAINTTWSFLSNYDVRLKAGINKKIYFRVHGTDIALIDNSGFNLGTKEIQFLSASGGNNRIRSYGGTGIGTWLFKSRYDDIIIDAGEGTNTPRHIKFRISGEDKMVITHHDGGRVGIKTSSPSYDLDVNGSLNANSLYNSGQLEWADFVFADNYQLRSFIELETYIEENNHLPDIPSEEEVLENGYDLGGMDAKLLRKIEELTLYLIKQNKEISQLKEEVKKLKKNKS